MKLPETFERMGGLGRAGAVTMAGGALALVGAIGLDFANDIEFEGHPIVDVQEEATVAMLGAGIVAMLGGQQMLMWDRRRKEK